MSFGGEFLRTAARTYNWNRGSGDVRTSREVADDIAEIAKKISRFHPHGQRLAAELLTELMFLGELMAWDIPDEMRKRNTAIRNEQRLLRLGERQ